MLSIDEERDIIAKIQKEDAVPACDRFFNSNPAPQTRPGTPDDPPPTHLSCDGSDVSLSRDQSDVTLSRDQSDVSHFSRGDVSLPSPGRDSSDSSPAPTRRPMKSLLYMYSSESD